MSKKFYESYVIFDGNLDDSAIEDLIKKYESLFSKNEIDVVNIVRIGRKRLAYEIKRKVNGFYVCFEINSPPGLITKLERAYILDENILRYLTIFVSAKTLAEKDEHFKHKAIMQAKFEDTKAKELKEELEKSAELEKTADNENNESESSKEKAL
ncbi:MAG TPA: 30S ribosomal protein S6 [Ignavibacteria bacterium]|nr:30S ribosomal protein S6 [Ignavibacteria bacterium]HRK00561.1 30S ribosomal protein S6 [Ignavibacteria bacterium]